MTMQNKKSVKDTAFLVLALVVIIGSRFMPAMGGLSEDAWAVLGVFFGSLIMWIGISIDWPSMITLLALGLIPIFGFSGTFAGAFGNTTVASCCLPSCWYIRFPRPTLCVAVPFIYHKQDCKKRTLVFCVFPACGCDVYGTFYFPRPVLFVAFMPFLEDIYQVLGLKKGGKAGNMIMMGSAFCISLSSGMTAIGHVWPTRPSVLHSGYGK